MKKLTTLMLLTFICQFIYAQQLLSIKAGLPLADTLYVDENDDWLVNKVTALLQSDIEKVTGKKPVIIHTHCNSRPKT
jgi:hypothetical protein